MSETIEEALIRHSEYIGKLTDAIKAIIEERKYCKYCDGTGAQNAKKDACPMCGGYGWNPAGDIHEVIEEANRLIS